jgi:hypothetical protein
MNKAEDNTNNLQQSQDGTDLERRLRSLPKPKVPDDLEAKLLEQIPSFARAEASGGQTGWWCVAAGVGAVAAGLLLVVLFHGGPSPELSAPTRATFAMSEQEIQRIIDRETISARLLASAEILARQPGGERDAAKTREYIARTYPDTSAAKRISDFDSHN